MDFELTDDQKMLVDTVSNFCKKESPPERLRKLRETELGWDKKIWSQMGELGWLGVAFPEDVGGFGGSFVDAGLILEQLGTTLVAEPFIPSVALAGMALLHFGTDGQKQEMLTPMIEGEKSLALAYAEAQSRHGVTDVQTRAEKSGDGFKLSGKKRWVLNGQGADHLLVSARTAGETRDEKGITVFAIDPGMKGVTRTTVDCMDSHKAAMVDLNGVEVGKDRVVGEVDGGAAVLDLVRDYGAAAACAEGSGIMQTVLAMTRQYLTEREQFGVKIGTFQSLQHRCVDMFVETELAKSTAIMAMIKIAEKDETARRSAVSAAKAQLGISGGFVGRQGIQLHGGIGVTDEHDVSLYFKRIQILATLFGDENFHTERYASLPAFEQYVETDPLAG